MVQTTLTPDFTQYACLRNNYSDGVVLEVITINDSLLLFVKLHKFPMLISPMIKPTYTTSHIKLKMLKFIADIVLLAS